MPGKSTIAWLLVGCGALVAAAVVLTLKPTIRSISPFDSEEGVHPGREVRVTLSGPVDPNGFSHETVTFLDDRNVPVPKFVSYSADEKLLVVQPREPMRWLSRYKVCVSASAPFPLPGESSRCSRFTVGGQPPQLPKSSNAPILIVTGKDNPFGRYYGEILRAEGLNLFATAVTGHLQPEALTHRAVVLLATSDVSPSERATLERWVQAGGSLIAMRPGSELLPLMGLKMADAPVRRIYLKASRMLAVSKGIVGEPIQIHGAADIFKSAEGEGLSQSAPSAGGYGKPVTVAQLYASPTRPLASPAVTLRQVGHGYAVAFAYDLARSVVYTRQGNPDWAGEERDGFPPLRANDLFYPDHLDLDAVEIPQADEQQRLLANLILTTARTPLPRFWYLPDNRRAAIIMAGDDHATKKGTANLFAKLSALSPPHCRLDHWECPRATAYLTPGTDFAPSEAEKYQQMGFETGVHVDTGCKDRDNATLVRMIASQLKQFQAKYSTLPQQSTLRIHCIVASGWVDLPRYEREHGIRFDLNYYYWPPSWTKGRPGFMTGSGFPMPYVDQNGNILEIYQAETQMVNENGVPQLQGAAFMLRRALGEEQFFGVFGTHYDFSDGFDDILISEARRQGVALISARQMLSWLDGRNGSQFDNVEWGNSVLTFTEQIARGAEAAYVMLPYHFRDRRIEEVKCGAERLTYSIETIKGLEFASFPARSEPCKAIYGPGSERVDGGTARVR